MYVEVMDPAKGGPRERTKEHRLIKPKTRFSYCSLLGELMYAHVTCRPDIGYSVATLSKFSVCPTKLHYFYLCGVVQYLSQKKNLSIHYQ